MRRYVRINGKSPAQVSIFLLLRSKCAHKVLVEKWRDNERMMRKAGLLHDPINFGFAGEVGNVGLAAADCFYIGQR